MYQVTYLCYKFLLYTVISYVYGTEQYKTDSLDSTIKQGDNTVSYTCGQTKMAKGSTCHNFSEH